MGGAAGGSKEGPEYLPVLETVQGRVENTGCLVGWLVGWFIVCVFFFVGLFVCLKKKKKLFNLSGSVLFKST